MRPVGRSTARWLRRGTGCTGTAARSLVTHGETLCTAIGWSSTAAPSYGPTTRSGSARCRAFLGAIDFSAAAFGTPRAGPATRKSGGIPATMQARGRDTRPPPRSAGRGVCSARPLRGGTRAPFLLCAGTPEMRPKQWPEPIIADRHRSVVVDLARQLHAVRQEKRHANSSLDEKKANAREDKMRRARLLDRHATSFHK